MQFIQQAMEQAGTTAYQLAHEMGWSHTGNLYRYTSGKRVPPATIVLKIAAVLAPKLYSDPRQQRAWTSRALIAAGHAPLQEDEASDSFPAPTPADTLAHELTQISRQIETALSKLHTPHEETEPMRALGLHPYTDHALSHLAPGGPPEFIDRHSLEGTVGQTLEGAEAFLVTGNSMAPKVRHGQVIYVRWARSAEVGDYVIARIPGEGLTFKQLAKDRLGPYLRAVNGSDHDIHTEFEIVGVVIARVTPMRD